MGHAFSDHERRLLLATRGIGETVVQRLEAAGFGSLQALCEAGAAQVAQQVRAQLGHDAWMNRRGAIDRVIAQAVGHQAEHARDGGLSRACARTACRG